MTLAAREVGHLPVLQFEILEAESAERRLPVPALSRAHE
jgi:hypothetical protein